MTVPTRFVYCRGATVMTGRLIRPWTLADDGLRRMSLWGTISEVLTRWTETVAAGIVALATQFVSPRTIRLVEDDAKPDSFTLQGGKVPGEKIAFANGRFTGGDLQPLAK